MDNEKTCIILIGILIYAAIAFYLYLAIKTKVKFKEPVTRLILVLIGGPIAWFVVIAEYVSRAIYLITVNILIEIDKLEARNRVKDKEARPKEKPNFVNCSPRMITAGEAIYLAGQQRALKAPDGAPKEYFTTEKLTCLGTAIENVPRQCVGKYTPVSN